MDVEATAEDAVRKAEEKGWYLDDARCTRCGYAHEPAVDEPCPIMESVRADEREHGALYATARTMLADARRYRETPRPRWTPVYDQLVSFVGAVEPVYERARAHARADEAKARAEQRNAEA